MASGRFRVLFLPFPCPHARQMAACALSTAERLPSPPLAPLSALHIRIQRISGLPYSAPAGMSPASGPALPPATSCYLLLPSATSCHLLPPPVTSQLEPEQMRLRESSPPERPQDIPSGTRQGFLLLSSYRAPFVSKSTSSVREKSAFPEPGMRKPSRIFAGTGNQPPAITSSGTSAATGRKSHHSGDFTIQRKTAPERTFIRKTRATKNAAPFSEDGA